MLFNDYKNIKTIIFSELPHPEKIKYFNFLLENEINFSRDESGNYVALVKVLNPAFYGAGQDQKTGQGERKRSIENKSNVTEHKDTDNDPVVFEGKPRSSSQVGKYQKGQPSNKFSSIKKGTFEKEKKVIVKKNYADIFNGKYKTFLQHINPLIGVRGKKLNLNTLKYSLEEIYSIRFINDTNMMNSKQEEESEHVPFPNFIFDFLSNKFVKKPVIDQHALDILFSVDYYSKTNDEIGLFSKFLNEEYEPDDLEFFLYVRSCIEKEMNMMFIEIARENMKKQYLEDYEGNDFLLNIKACLSVANAIYGNEEEELLNSFMKQIEEILSNQRSIGQKKNFIKASQILLITLNDYREHKGRGNQESGKKDSRQCDMSEEQDVNQNQINIKKDTTSSDTYFNLQKNFGEGVCANDEDKASKLKAIIGAYIKRKELDVFFNELLSSYSIFEKSSKGIEEIMTSIKDLVSKKVNLLIQILFEENEKGWYNSLKIVPDSEEAKEYYYNLQALINQMMQYEKLNDIPENVVEEFSRKLLSTPELNNQINKLVLKRFE